MSQYDYKPEYQRNLPHIQPPGATLFVTFRLAGSIPTAVLEQLKEEAEEQEQRIRATAVPVDLPYLLYQEQKRQFARWDAVLDRADSGPRWLGQPEIATIVVDSLHFLDGNVYDMDTFTVMPTHVHAVFQPLAKEDGSYHALQKILHSLKRHTAWEANKLLERDGAFWQHESYDHVVRDRREWERIVAYVLNNPVKAGLVQTWEEWPWSYLKE
ncbi:MAG TPA: hypothetical protein PLK31_07580 [Chloroflexota bacterium]|nr:hypothetical protein [Chloroflexota bacterium]